ncbi:protein of unknown function [Evansella caseinilytica]|uniref:Protein-glutamine gamma-glutamyltransferase-like C-terminal domain-containing protein n=1 Tax=Evansella caseinilytica TaxID=1503961 RepID=A0A1H3NWT8_9BACI|nr:DUF4129 domain-containing protein [Evansella caseinilytica]SDY93163.1 protein of unknown function [Evansella caseinilytica]
MIGNMKNLIVSWGCCWLEWLCLFPIILLIAVLSFPGGQGIWLWPASLPLLFLAALVIALQLKKQRKWMFLGVSMLISLVFTVLWEFPYAGGLAAFAVAFLFAYRGTLYSCLSTERLLPGVYLWLSLTIYFAGYFVFRSVDPLPPFLAFIQWPGILLLFLTLMLTNSRQLTAAALAENEKHQSVPRTLRWHNRMFIVLTFLFIVFITNFRLIQEAVLQTISILFAGVSWLASLLETDETAIPEQEVVEMPLPEIAGEAEQSFLMAILERVFWFTARTAVILILVLIAVYLIKKIVQWLQHAVPKLIAFLKQAVNGQQEPEQHGYIDEKEAAIDWEQWRKHSQAKLMRWVRKRWTADQKWQDLKTSREQARYLYRQYIRKQIRRGFPFQPAKTPKEIVSDLKAWKTGEEEVLDELAALYETARYSKEELPKELLLAVKKQLEEE